MKGILNGKLYDTEKADLIRRISLPTSDIHEPFDVFCVYKTENGDIFTEYKNGECLIDENALNSALQISDCSDIFAEDFGEVEET